MSTQVLGADGVVASSLRIERGRVAALGARPRPGDVVVDLDGAIVAPGLINAHDHLELNNFPRLKWRDRYANARDWIADFQPRFETDPALMASRAVPLRDRLLIGALKNLLAGATTVCHHNPLYPALRRDFPVRVVRTYRYSHSLLIDGDEAVARAYRRTPRDWPWIIHLAEGADDEAAAELDRLDRLGCLGPNTIVVHGVGLSSDDRRKLVGQGGGLVWCPASNLFTLGATADVRDVAGTGKAALGSDSRLSGERDLLAEMRVALQTGQVDARTIFRMVTCDAASILRLPQAGRLAIGAPADLAIFPAQRADAFESIACAGRADVRLVMIDGRAVFGDADMQPVFAATRTAAECVQLDGRHKLLARRWVDRLRRASIGEPGLEIDA